jgi:hypothetical protein
MTIIRPAFGAFTRSASRRLKLFVSAGAIALAGLASTAAPARAQTSDELIRFLLGAAAVGLVVRAIEGSASTSRARVPRGELPVACMESVRMHRRHVDVYHSGCLGWYGIDRLPRRCEVQLRTDRGRRNYHLAQCLHESGWRPQYASVPSRPRHDWSPPRRRDWYEPTPRRRDWYEPTPPWAHPRRDCPPGWQGSPRRHHYQHCERGRWSHR